MVALLAEQLRDERSLRVWPRLFVDIALTVPARRMEAVMNRSSSSAVTVVFAIVAVAGLIAALVGGLYAVPTLVGGIIALGFGSLAVVSARRSSALAGATVRSHWWKFLVGGASTLALLVIVTNLTGELPDGGWAVAMTVLFASLASMVTGLVLGLARLSVGGGRPAAG
jgi:hypothetical protein